MQLHTQEIIMKRIHCYAAAALTLCVFACNHDKTSTTNTTSAPLDPIDRSTATQPPPAVPMTDENATPSRAATTTTNPNGTRNIDTTDMSGAGTPPATLPADQDQNFGGVAPGHIMYPPGSARGTGQPNDNGSHNMGATAPAGAR